MSKLPLRIIIIVSKIISGPFSATFGQNWGSYGHKNFSAKRYFLLPRQLFFKIFGHLASGKNS